MSQSNDPPVVSRTFSDIDTPGVMAEVDQDEAERMGAFKEDALTFDDALEANVEVGS